MWTIRKYQPTKAYSLRMYIYKMLAACLCTGMRPFVESCLLIRTRRSVLRVRAKKKHYHLEGLQAQTLADPRRDNKSEGFVLRCDVSGIILYLKSYQVYELYFVSGRLIDGNRFSWVSSSRSPMR